MQEKNESRVLPPPIDNLPEDLITRISSQLDKTDEPQHIKSARRQHFSLFRTDRIQKNRILAKLAQYAAEGKIKRVESLLKIRPDLRIQVLFTLAGLGAQEEMEQILKQHPEDLLLYRPLRDISGAEFERITLLQHAIWTKDVHYMANMFINCLPKNEQGEKIRVALEQQAKIHMDKGVVYQLKGVRHENERQFNLQPLKTELHIYVENYKHWTEEQRKKHWCTVVGLAQTLIPAHIRHHYCDSEAFWNNPNFKRPKLKRSLEIYNWILSKSQLWSEGLVGLGSDYGIWRPAGQVRRVWGAKWAVLGSGAAENLQALTALDKAWTEIDLPALIERLHTPIQNLEDKVCVPG